MSKDRPVCPICKSPIEVFKVFTREKKFKKMNGVCIPCREREEKERLKKMETIRER